MADDVGIVHFLRDEDSILWKKRGSRTTRHRHWSRLDTNLIPQTLHNKRLQGLCASLYDKALHMMGIEGFKVKRMTTVDNQPLRVGSRPVTYVQLRVLTLVGDTPYKDSIGLSTQFMYQHLGKGCRECQGLPMIVYETVGRLCPFQQNVRTA